MLFPTSLVGSYPQPDWLINRERLRDRFPPRVRAKELWRVDPDHLEQAQRDATLLAIRAQEEAGLDIVTEVAGRVRRALPYVPAERLVLAPDCGMKYLPRDVAFGKLTAMTTAAARLRDEMRS